MARKFLWRQKENALEERGPTKGRVRIIFSFGPPFLRFPPSEASRGPPLAFPGDIRLSANTHDDKTALNLFVTIVGGEIARTLLGCSKILFYSKRASSMLEVARNRGDWLRLRAVVGKLGKSLKSSDLLSCDYVRFKILSLYYGYSFEASAMTAVFVFIIQFNFVVYCGLNYLRIFNVWVYVFSVCVLYLYLIFVLEMESG